MNDRLAFMEKIIEHFKNSRFPVLCSHAYPDGDAVGALLALGLALRQLGKKVLMFNESRISPRYRFLPCVDEITCHLDFDPEHDIAVVLDCENITSVGESSFIIGSLPTVINIDHHESNTGFGDLRLVDTRACGAAEIVYRIIKKMSLEIDQSIAMAIYTGILTDTGSFRFKNTNAAAFAIGSEMIAIGVRPDHVSGYLYGVYSLGFIKLWRHAVESLELSDNGMVAAMTLSREVLSSAADDAAKFDANEIASYVGRLKGVKLVALILDAGPDLSFSSEKCRFLQVILKSKGDVDAMAIATHYGGSGSAIRAEFFCYTTFDKIRKFLIGLSNGLHKYRRRTAPNRFPGGKAV